MAEDPDFANAPNDPSIPDDAVLLRIIRPDWIHRVPNEPVRPEKVAFTDRHTDCTSVFIQSETSIDDLMRDHPEKSLCGVFASVPRGLGFRLVRDPDHGGPGHVLIVPSPKNAPARTIAKAAIWVILRDP